MTRTQIQIPDILYGRARRFADSHEISLAEVCRNALSLYFSVHDVDGDAPRRKRWTVPVCRPTGLSADPFEREDWREAIYAERGV